MKDLAQVAFDMIDGFHVVFLIRGKILKPGFRVAEKRSPGKPVFGGFWNECDFER